MSKKIAVQDGLDNVKEKLISLGYEVVDINQAQDIDAIIYMADGYDTSYYGQITNMNTGDNMTNRSGTLLINRTGKSLEEIDYIIKNKTYSPLFD